MGHFEDHTTIACSQLTDLLKVIILQLPNLLFLGEERFQALSLLLIQLQLLQLLLQGFQICPARARRAGLSSAVREQRSELNHSIFTPALSFFSHPHEKCCCKSDFSEFCLIPDKTATNPQDQLPMSVRSCPKPC